jgi:UDP-glucose 4-epimerase
VSVVSKRPPNVVVTGGARSSGSHFVDRRLAQEREAVVDNLTSGACVDVAAVERLEKRGVMDLQMGLSLAKWHGEVLPHCVATMSVASLVRDPGLSAA